MMPGIWTVADHSVYAVRHRPDGTPAARFHVIAEAHEAAGPSPAHAAERLLRVIAAGRSRTAFAGDFWQSRLGPLLARFAPEPLVRAYLLRYYNMR